MATNSRPIDTLVPGAMGGFDHAEDAAKFGHLRLWGRVAGEATGTFQRESDDADDYPAVGDEQLRAAVDQADGVRSRTPELSPTAYECPLYRYFDLVDFDEATRVQLGGNHPFKNMLLYQARQAAWMARLARVASAKRHAAWIAQGAAVFHPDSVNRAGNAIDDDDDLDGLLVDAARKSGADCLYLSTQMYDLVRRHPSVLSLLPDNVNGIHTEESLVALYLGPQLGIGRLVVDAAHENPKNRTDYILEDHIVFAKTEMANVGRDPEAPAEDFVIPVISAGAVHIQRSVNYFDEVEMAVAHGAVLADPAVVPQPELRARLAGMSYVCGEYKVRSNSKEHGILLAEQFHLLDRTAIFTITNVAG